MLTGTVSFLLGNVITHYYLFSFPRYWLLLAFFSVLTVRFFISPLFLTSLIAFIIGALWTFFAINGLLDRLTQIEDLRGKTLVIQGEVSSTPEYSRRKVRFEFKTKSQPALPASRLDLSWYQPNQRVQLGQRWQFSVRLKKPRNYYNPGYFDYARQLISKGIFASGYVTASKHTHLLDSSKPFFSLIALRSGIAKRIEKTRCHEGMGGLLSGLTVGLRKQVTPSEWQVMRATGTNHLLAISGLHIGFLVSVGYFLFRWLACLFPNSLLRVPAQQIGLLGGLLFGTLYAALAGFSIPTQRALWMVFVFVCAHLLKRGIDPWCVYSVAILGVLIADPMATLSMGFWLSFSAVGWILYATCGREKKGKIRSVLTIQWVVTFGLAPFTLFYFHQLSTVSLPANLLAIPWIGYVTVPLSLLSVAVSFISQPLSDVLLHYAGWSLTVIWSYLTWLSETRFALLDWPSFSVGILISMNLGSLILMTPRNLMPRCWGAVCLLPLFFPSTQQWQSGDFQLTTLDVGQGLSIFIKTKEHALLFDTGPKWSERFNAGKHIVLPYLREQGVYALDKVIVSHSDSDHSGGLSAILREWPLTPVVTGTPKKLVGVLKPQTCLAGQHWEWDGVDFTFLYPSIDHLQQGNNSSCVLRITNGEKTILLTGDIEKKAEVFLLKNEKYRLKSDILVAPHHGSRSSSSAQFVKAVRPNWVVFSTGYRNRYRFPHQSVVRRYKGINAKRLNTANEGAITFYLSKNHPTRLNVFRETQKGWWH